MRKHGGTPSRRGKHVTLAAISPPSVARGRFVGGQQSGLAGCKPPPLFMRGTSSCPSQGRREGEPLGASPRPSAPTDLPSPLVSDPNRRGYCAVKEGDGHYKYSEGEKSVDVCMGNFSLPHVCIVMDTSAFQLFLGHEVHPSKRQYNSWFDFCAIETHCQESRD